MAGFWFPVSSSRLVFEPEIRNQKPETRNQKLLSDESLNSARPSRQVLLQIPCQQLEQMARGVCAFADRMRAIRIRHQRERLVSRHQRVNQGLGVLVMYVVVAGS